MKIIFLDIDGVLNNLEFLSKHKRETGDNFLDMIDPKAISLLNYLVEKSGANIVISSSWRLGHTIVMIQHLFSGSGFLFPERIIGTTSAVTYKDRGFEISLWLKQVPVDSFVILDDDCDMTGVMDHLVQTEIDVGLTKENVKQALEILIK